MIKPRSLRGEGSSGGGGSRRRRWSRAGRCGWSDSSCTALPVPAQSMYRPLGVFPTAFCPPGPAWQRLPRPRVPEHTFAFWAFGKRSAATDVTFCQPGLPGRAADPVQRHGHQQSLLPAQNCAGRLACQVGLVLAIHLGRSSSCPPTPRGCSSQNPGPTLYLAKGIYSA